MFLEAKNIQFQAKIDGKSRVFIVVSPGGDVESFDRISGGSKVYWRKKNADDPLPKVKLPKPEHEAEVKEITDAKEWDALVIGVFGGPV